MRKPWVVSCVVVALAAGWGLGRLGKAAPPPGDEAVSTKSEVRDGRRTRFEGGAQAGVRTFEELLAAGGSDRRILNALTRQLDGCGEEELGEMLKLLDSAQIRGSWGKRMVAVQMIFERWAEIDPNAALGQAMELDRWDSDQAMQAVFSTMVKTDAQGAWTLARSVTEGPLQRRASEIVLGSMAETDPQGAFALLKSIPGLEPSPLFASWAKVNPVEALEACRTLPGTGRNGILGSVFGQWFRDDEGAAMAAFDQLEGLERRSAADSILGTWQSLDVDAAAAWAAEHPGECSDDAMRSVCREMGRNDPQAAVAWAGEHLKDNVRIEALEGVFGEWASRSPGEAAEWLKTVANPAEQVRIAKDGFWWLAWSSPQEAVALAKDIGESNFDGWFVQQIGQQLAGLDMKRAMEIVDTFDTDNFKDGMRQGIVEAWMGVDPEGALTFAMGEPNESKRTGMLGVIAAQMADRDPARALSLAETLPPGQSQTRVVTEAIEQWVGKSPQDASAYVAGLSDPVVKEAALQTLLRSWSWQDGEAAFKFAESQDGGAAHQGMMQAAGQWAERDPEGAFRYISRLPAGGSADSAVAAVLRHWAGESPADAASALEGMNGGTPKMYESLAATWSAKEPDQALQWASRLSDPAAQAGAYEAISQNWAERDPTSAGQWLSGLSEGEPRDKAVMAYAQQVVGVDPASSLGWAASIGDESRRWDTVKSLANRWYQRDSNAAVGWLEDQGFSEAQIREATRD
ncbi:hypothetical protein [Haloferula sargassicola]|uniref:Uncharacterized protein n=1 Tax=Haloferula sargassicola TaxID=490096 RepID=A0ABP9UIE2_9BACT